MVNEELKDKINEAMAGENDYLIGDIEFDEDELSEMQTFFRNRAAVIRSASDLGDDDLKIFIVYVVNKLREWNKEWPGNMFWDRVSEMFENDANVSKLLRKSQLYDKLSNTLEKSNRVVFVNENSGSRLFAQTFLFQAFSTKESMQAFIQLAWNLYINEDLLDCDYPDSDLEFCNYIINNLKSKYSNVDSDEEVQFSGATYNIKAALRYGIFQNEKTAFLLDRIFRYIYRVDYNNEDICDNHLGLLVTDKVNELKQLYLKTGNKRKTNKMTVRGIVYTFDKLKPQYKFNDDPNNPKIYLSFPKLMLINSKKYYDYYNVDIYNNGVHINKSLYDRCYAKHNEGITIFNPIEIDITDYIYNMKGKIDLEIKINTNFSGEEYCFGELLNREYILFKGTSEVKGNCRQGDYILIATSDFDLSKVVLIDETGIYSPRECVHAIETSDGDCIIGDFTRTIFGSQKKDQIQFREEPTETNNIYVVKDDVDIPVYKEVSDLMISLKNDEVPNTIIVKHIFYPYNSSQPKLFECRVNELAEEGIRYVYPNNDFSLSGRGYHEIQINKLTGSGSKSILTSPIKYCVDKNIKVITQNKIMYLNGNFDINIRLFDEKFAITTRSDSYDGFIETNQNIKIHVIFPYFKWRFGTFFDSIVHTSEINSNKPLFVDDIYSSSETIEIDSFFDVLRVMFVRENEQDVELTPTNKSNTKFNLSELLQACPGKGGIIAYLENGIQIPLFSITNEPYVIDRILDDCFEYSEHKLIVDFSKYFIHDHFDYLLNLTMINLDTAESFELNKINPNNKVEYVNDNLIDGDYEIELGWIKIIGGLEEAERKIYFNTPQEIQIGNPLLVEFNRINEITIDKTKVLINDKLENIKFKDYVISNLRFVGYNEIEELVFSGKLRYKNAKSLDVSFIIKDYRGITQLKSNGKMINYDNDSKTLSLNDIMDNKVYQMYTLYIRY